MAERSTRSRLRRCLLLGGLLTAVVALDAAAYKRPTAEPPTAADLLLSGGKSNSLAVVVLNLTPYEIVQADRDTLEDKLDTDRKSKESFMFAPVGAPRSIPPLDGSWIGDPDNDTCKLFTAATNNPVHPYSMVFSFDDHGGWVDEGYFSLRLNHVMADGCHPTQVKDVDIGFFFTRSNSKRELFSEVFHEITAAITVVIDTIGLIIEPENPIAWYDEFLAVKELGSSSFEIANSEDTGGKRVYFAAYPWPDQGSGADQNGAGADLSVLTDCEKCGDGDTSDGVDAGWNAAFSGTYSGNFVVTTHILRGHDPSVSLPPGTALNAPVAFVVIWTNDLYDAATAVMAGSALEKTPSGRRLRSHLGHRNARRLFALAHLFGSLDAEQRATYWAAYNALRAHRQLTDEQKVLLERLAVAFESGRTSLEREPHPDQQRHERPGPERPDHDGRPEVNRDNGQQ